MSPSNQASGRPIELFPRLPEELEKITWKHYLGTTTWPSPTTFLYSVGCDGLGWPMFHTGADHGVYLPIHCTDIKSFSTGINESLCIGKWSDEGNDSTSSFLGMAIYPWAGEFEKSDRWQHILALLGACQESRLFVLEIWIEECLKVINGKVDDQGNVGIGGALIPSEWTVAMLEEERDRLKAALGR